MTRKLFIFISFPTLLALFCWPAKCVEMGSVGTACWSDANCTGPNEFCEFWTWLEPSCQSGVCSCLPCHTNGIGGSNSCLPFKYLQLNELCQNSYEEVIVPSHALCVDGVVGCEQSYAATNGAECEPLQTALAEGTACDYHTDECKGDMWCGWNYTCECRYDYEKYDATTDSCIRKNLGDKCEKDYDCQVMGRQFNGFTFLSSKCEQGVCTCGKDQRTTAAYYDLEKSSSKKRDICVTSQGVVDQPQNGQCTVDPVFYSDSPDVKVCKEDFLCVTCPEDENNLIGKCRKLIAQPPPSPICQKPNATVIAAVEPEGTRLRPSTTTTTTTTTSTTTTTTISTTSKIEPHSTEISSSSTASEIEPHSTEISSSSTASEIEPHSTEISSSSTTSAIWMEPSSLPWTTSMISTTVSTPSSTTTSTTSTIPTTTTTTTSTSTSTTAKTTTTTTPKPSTTSKTTAKTQKASSTTTTTAKTSKTVKPAKAVGSFFNKTCVQKSDCDFKDEDGSQKNGLVCRLKDAGNQKFCLCEHEHDFWVESDQRCHQFRHFGDSCLSDDECSNSIYTLPEIKSYACTRARTCGCAADFTEVRFAASVLYGFPGEAAPTIAPVASYCVMTEKMNINVPANGNCSANILNDSGSTTYVCAPNLLCFINVLRDINFGKCIQNSEITTTKKPVTTAAVTVKPTTRQEQVTTSGARSSSSVSTVAHFKSQPTTIAKPTKIAQKNTTMAVTAVHASMNTSTTTKPFANATNTTTAIANRNATILSVTPIVTKDSSDAAGVSTASFFFVAICWTLGNYFIKLPSDDLILNML